MGLPVNDTVVEELCPKGHEIVKGECIPIDSKSIDHEIESSSLPYENIEVHEEEPVTEVNILKKMGACPEGYEHGEYGICHEITHVGTTEITTESTTDFDEKLSGEEHLRGCPKGTERDEDGYCREINPSKPRKLITDPKVLLKNDGSCPDNYKMVEGQCLYVKPKVNSKLSSNYVSVDDNVSNSFLSKSDDENVKYELVPVLSDNSCPQGTEYSEYGLCKKRLRLSTASFSRETVVSCPADHTLINGKCTFIEKPITTDELPQSTSSIKSTTEHDVIEKPDLELRPEVTSTPF
jgi:hypothetical protein